MLIFLFLARYPDLFRFVMLGVGKMLFGLLREYSSLLSAHNLRFPKLPAIFENGVGSFYIQKYCTVWRWKDKTKRKSMEQPNPIQQ